MNTRNMFFTVLLIVALALGAGLIMAQDDGGGSEEDSNAKQHQDFARRGGFGRGFHGFGGRGMAMPRGFGMPGLPALMDLVTEATGLELDALREALSGGDSLASLIEANGGDVEAFITAMSENANAMVDAAVESGRLDAERAASYREGMTARLEALVHGEFEAGGKGFDGRGRQQDKGGREGSGEHVSRMGQKESGGEESGATLTLDETYDFVRKGVRLIMAWDATANAFVGTVENVTNATISQVRVEVHLSNGVELGPSPTVSLAAGEVLAVELSAAGTSGFDGWTPHAETGSGEHSAGDGEHGGSEGEGEHGSEGEGGSG